MGKLSKEEAKKVISWMITIMGEYVSNPSDENLNKLINILVKYRSVVEDAVLVAMRPEFRDLESEVLSILGVSERGINM